jgi:murein DD-endopeptidase MepM/ murein hydrolase activator NlpD
MAEAASPDVSPTIETSDVHRSAEAPPIAPPSAIAPPATVVTVETIVAPSVADTVATPAATPVTTPVATPAVEQQAPSAALAEPPTPVPSPASDQPVPEVAKPEGSAQSQTRTANEPQTTNSSSTSSEAVEASPQPTTDRPANNPEKPQTLAQMRETLDQKLAAIVARDKATREAQLRQNLIASALYYAQTGAFPEAHQVAQNPGLPTEIQTELFAKINELAVQAGVTPIPPSQVAAVPGTPTTETATKPAPLPNTAVSFSPVYSSAASGTSAGAAWVGSEIGSQCPANAQMTVEASAKAVKAAPSKPEIPQLGQKSAAALVAVATQQKLAQQKAKQPESKTAEAKPAVTSTASQPLPTSQPAPQQNLDLKPIAPQKAVQLKTPATKSVDFNRVTANPEVSNAGEFQVEQMIGSFFKEPLKEVGITLSDALPSVIKSALSWWTPTIDKTQAITAKSIVPKIADQPASTATKQTNQAIPTDHPSATEPAPVLQVALDNTALSSLESRLPILQPQVKNAVKVSLALPKTNSPDAIASQKTTAPQTAPLNCFGIPVASNDINATFTPTVAKQMGWGNLVFPLPVPSVLTSTFGWRVHPISGDRRFHTGLDLAAAMGTPVVSAQAGRVVAADSMGGYGLAVIIENAAGNYRTLYGHLSGIAVRPGTALEAGTVVGWVGSTGNSTGPHLHFETLVLNNSGWTAIDPLSSGNTAVAQAAQ